MTIGVAARRFEETVDFQLNVNTDVVGHLPYNKAVCVSGETSVRDVLRVLQQHKSGCVLVVRDEQLQGIFTERDALNCMAACEGLDEPVSAAMIPDVVAVEKSDTLAIAIEKMAVGGYRHLPVVEQGRPRGVLEVSAILHYLVDHFPQVVYTLPPEPHHSPQNREGA